MRLLFTLLIAASFLNSDAQISILESDMSVVGDVVVRYNDTIPTYGPGGDGPNQTWDFTQAVVDETITTTVEAPSSTPYASDFTGSNLAMSSGTGAYLFFSQNASQLITDGAAGDLLETGEIIVAPFSDPLTLHNFPRVYGDFHDDTYSFVAEADGAAFSVERIRLNHNGHVYDTTDAYGTLITPTGTYDVVRVKTVDFTTDVIDVQLTVIPIWTNAFITSVDTSVSYSWHAKNEKLAIAEFAFDSIGNPARFTYSSIPPTVTTGLDNDLAETSIVVYPQPTTDRICVEGADGMNYQLFSIQGKMALNGRLNSQCIEVSELNAGIYILRLLTSEGIVKENVKIVKSN